MFMIHSYYFELKNRCFLLFLTWISTIFASYFYKEILLFICLETGICATNNDFCYYYIFTDVKEIFSAYIAVIFFFSHQILILYTVFHILSFSSFGLYKFEYYYLKKIFCVLLFFFFFNFMIFHKVLFPLSKNFFLSFQWLTKIKSLNFYFESKINEYLEFYIQLYGIYNFYFQMFVVLFYFLDFINTNLKLINRIRKIFYYLFVCFSTAITPPDVTSQILLSVFLILIYESLIFINIVLGASRKKI